MQTDIISRHKAMYLISRYGLPVASSYTFSLSIVAIGFIIWKLHNDDPSTPYLPASTLIINMLQNVSMASISCLYSMSILASREYGEFKKLLNENPDSPEISRYKKEISDILKNGHRLSLAILPAPFFIFFFSGSLLHNALAQDKEIAYLAQDYLRIFSYVFIFLLGRMCAEETLFACKKFIAAMSIGIIDFIIGTIFAVYFVFGKLNLKLTGIAYGYSIEAFLTFLGYSSVLFFSKDFRGFKFFLNQSISRSDLKQFKSIFNLGFPIILQNVSESIASFLLAVFSGWLGKDELASLNFSSVLTFITMIPLIAFGQVVSQQVSRMIGKESFANATRYARYGLLASIAINIPLCLFASIYPSSLTYFVADSISNEVLTMSHALIPITAFQILINTARYNMVQTLRATDDLLIPTIISEVFLWVGMSIAYILAFKMDGGIYGAVIGYTTGMVLGVGSLAPRWYKLTKEECLAQLSTEQNEVSYFSFFSNAYKKLKICYSGEQYQSLTDEAIGDMELNTT